MAEVKNNIITLGLSGMLGKQVVFTQRGGKTIVGKAPRERQGEPTEAQEQHQARFQSATVYALRVLKDPEDKAEYEKKADKLENVSAYNLAVADMLLAPKIEKIDLSAYTGQIGSTITVQVTDDFKVVSVSVNIQNSDGTIVESGKATEANGVWVYTATAVNEDTTGDKITVEATDLPENVTQKTETV